MSIFKLNQLDFQTVTVATNPNRFYSSSSSGVTGSLHIFQRRSEVEKELRPLEGFLESTFNDKDIENSINSIKNAVKNTNNNNVLNNLKDYLDVDVKNQSVSARKQKKLDIIRFTPTPVSGSVEDALPNYTYFSKNYLRKSIIKNNLSTYYKSAYPSAHWGYCNYHSLNFFSSSTTLLGYDNKTALVYPNYDDGRWATSYPDHASGVYTVHNNFSFDFHINPRYNSLEKGHFKAGTIFHLSSSYAVSLITGSKKDFNGLPIGFRLMLQLSHSADVQPSRATSGVYPDDLIFISDDNSLTWNNWHHAVIRWGGESVNNGTGSFIIDGINKGDFSLPSGTISPKIFKSSGNPDALLLGNFFEGNNVGLNQQKKFFTNLSKQKWGTYELDPDSTVDEPWPLILNHPLQAELHNLTIKNYYVTDAEIAASSSYGPNETALAATAFYLPPFFVEKTAIRSQVPWRVNSINSGTTVTPFNIQLAFGSNGHLINTENFLKDFSTNNFARQIGYEYSWPTISGPTKKANDYIYDVPSNRKRNLLILPCDDGNFYPNYDVLRNEEFLTTRLDDYYSFSPGFISLNDMIALKSQYFNAQEPASEQSIASLIVTTPENPVSSNIGSSIFAYQNQTFNLTNHNTARGVQYNFPAADVIRTKDNSSNQITFFDISNLYYGLNIIPGSFMLHDNALTGSGGAVRITIKDNGNGTLYRADSETKHCQWNAVGTIFYNEGIIAIKNPHLYFFGKDQFEMSFKGEQNIHTLRFEVVAPANLLNSSSNPTYENIPSTLRPNEYDSKFVYITGINFHDDNLNVVMKTQLAQPIMKRHTDKIAFKVKYDW